MSHTKNGAQNGSAQKTPEMAKTRSKTTGQNRTTPDNIAIIIETKLNEQKQFFEAKLAEQRAIFETQLTEQGQRFAEQIKSCEERIMQCMSGLSANISNIGSDVKQLIKRVVSLENRCNGIDEDVEKMKASISALESAAVASDFVVLNIPNQVDTSSAIRKLFEALSCPIQPRDVFRVNKNSDSHNCVPIIVKLQSPSDRSKLFRSIAEFRKTHKRQLTVAECGASGDTSIMVNECITLYNRNILNTALNYRRRNVLYSAFTLRGVVYVRIKKDGSAIRVPNIDTLKKIVGDANVIT